VCLSDNMTIQYTKERNRVLGYKILRWTSFTPAWRSQLSSQKWEFGVLVKAVNKKKANFRGRNSSHYLYGIHAWRQLRFIQRYTPPFKKTEILVKVLLFGVTHGDKVAYRADAAMVIEALDRDGNRIPWRPPKVKTLLTIRKYNGDDAYSWAVFKKKDIRGIKGVIFYGQAKPLVSGCSKMEAKYHKDKLEEKYASGGTT